MMKFKLLPFFLLYILVPFLVIPFFSIKFGNPYGFFGIGFYFSGLIISRYKQWIFLPIPIVFCLWYWYTYGFGIRDYVSVFFACMVNGIIIQQVFLELHKYVSKILPEQESNVEYNEKLEEMNRQIENYKRSHPNEKVTSELIEKIRTDVFFQ